MPKESAGILLYRRNSTPHPPSSIFRDPSPNAPGTADRQKTEEGGTISRRQPHPSLTNQSEGWGFQVFLAHPGGPFWAEKDVGAWTIPKGEIESGDRPLDTAIREFEEETGVRLDGPFRHLGTIRQKSGKVVHAWACEGDADPDSCTSNEIKVRWAGKTITVPEVDRCEWFDPQSAMHKINPAQAELIVRLAKLVTDEP